MKFLYLNCAILATILPALPLVAATVTVTTIDNASTAGDGQTSLLEALQAVGTGDTVAFDIPGAGPHIIVTPLGGYPLLTANDLTIDGYTQPGSSPNTNPILGGNNAQIRIVLDSTDASTGPNDPQDPTLNSRRSTRILHSGYGDSENGILAMFGGDNFTVRGLSFIARHTDGSTADPGIYCVALVNQAMNAKVQGCWFGLAPGGSTQSDIKPASAAVAAFRYRTGGDVYSEGLIVGTDGDGVSDRSEFNVLVGGHIPLALELPRARISGNYFNVFPDGNTFVDVDEIHQRLLATGRSVGDSTVENIENGRVTEGTIIGTNGDGVSDSDERNIFAHANYDQNIEFYSNAQRAVVAGNYFGVGIDGTTAAPVPTAFTPILMDLPDSGSVRIGSNGDGVSDDLEGNLIYNVPGSGFCTSGGAVPIVFRGNRLSNNGFSGLPFAEDDGSGRNFGSYYATFVAAVEVGLPPQIQGFTNNVIHGFFTQGNAGYPHATVDVYLVDEAPLAKTNFWPKPMVHPKRLLASFADNGPEDLNTAPGEFAFDVAAFALTDTTYLSLAVNYSLDSGRTEVLTSVTSPMSNPVSRRPTLNMQRVGSDIVSFWWFGPKSLYFLQLNDDLSKVDGWFEIFNETYTLGRNVLDMEFFPSMPAQFFRLASF